ncbi:hypothetical protein DH2020_000790 [Rehmannia glutinosa]|uniref:CBS domain-containing protein n=1 Tax=Rehmannia glutinosa TaxID=99300 RepID=A0ABR0XXH3_REHGL
MSVICGRCGLVEETSEHALRDCEWNVFYWAASPLRIRLPHTARGTMGDWIEMFRMQGDEERHDLFAMLLWGAWWARNEQNFAKVFVIVSIIHKGTSNRLHEHTQAMRMKDKKEAGLKGNTNHNARRNSSNFLSRSVLKNAVLRHVRVASPAMRSLMFARHESTSAARIEEHGFESTTISDVLTAKGKSADGSWLWCTTEDSVYEAVKSMTQHNVGALVVVKPGEQKSIAGIITERDYLRKIIIQGRSSKSTKVGDIMTEENKLITVTPDTKVLKAMQLMTDNRIRHIPVINEGGMIGMVSIGDVVRAVVSEHRDELNRLNAFIQGGY